MATPGGDYQRTLIALTARSRHGRLIWWVDKGMSGPTGVGAGVVVGVLVSLAYSCYTSLVTNTLPQNL